MTEKSKGIDQVKFEETNLLLKQITANGLTKDDERYMREATKRLQKQSERTRFAEEISSTKASTLSSLQQLSYEIGNINHGVLDAYIKELFRDEPKKLQQAKAKIRQARSKQKQDLQKTGNEIDVQDKPKKPQEVPTIAEYKTEGDFAKLPNSEKEILSNESAKRSFVRFINGLFEEDYFTKEDPLTQASMQEAIASLQEWYNQNYITTENEKIKVNGKWGEESKKAFLRMYQELNTPEANKGDNNPTETPKQSTETVKPTTIEIPKAGHLFDGIPDTQEEIESSKENMLAFQKALNFLLKAPGLEEDGKMSKDITRAIRILQERYNKTDASDKSAHIEVNGVWSQETKNAFEKMHANNLASAEKEKTKQKDAENPYQKTSLSEEKTQDNQNPTNETPETTSTQKMDHETFIKDPANVSKAQKVINEIYGGPVLVENGIFDEMTQNYLENIQEWYNQDGNTPKIAVDGTFSKGTISAMRVLWQKAQTLQKRTQDSDTLARALITDFLNNDGKFSDKGRKKAQEIINQTPTQSLSEKQEVPKEQKTQTQKTSLPEHKAQADSMNAHLKLNNNYQKTENSKTETKPKQQETKTQPETTKSLNIDNIIAKASRVTPEQIASTTSYEDFQKIINELGANKDSTQAKMAGVQDEIIQAIPLLKNTQKTIGTLVAQYQNLAKAISENRLQSGSEEIIQVQNKLGSIVLEIGGEYQSFYIKAKEISSTITNTTAKSLIDKQLADIMSSGKIVANTLFEESSAIDSGNDNPKYTSMRREALDSYFKTTKSTHTGT